MYSANPYETIYLLKEAKGPEKDLWHVLNAVIILKK